jgi:hypothetical protein
MQFTRRRRTIKYNLVSVGNESSVTAFIDGEMYVANQDHKNWDQIVAGITSGDESVVRLFDPAEEVAKRFERLTDRISVANGKVYFDGDHVDNAITDHILRMLEADEDFMSLVNFMDKLYQNPEQHSREQLYGWIKARPSITITSDGDLIAYKGLYSETDEDGTLYKSWHSGSAIVNGEWFNDQQIPQRIGDTVEMPRSQVEFNPYEGCSTGLHAGTFDYARSYGNSRVKVAINPRDVVSVPTEHNEAKIRVCRYVVIDVADEEVKAPVWNVVPIDGPTFEDDEDELPFYCAYCGDNDDHDTEDCDSFDDEEDEDEDYYSAYGPQYGF